MVRYELGSYWIENSYSEELDNILIEEYMSRDRVKWLKDIAKRVSEQEEQEQVIEGYLGNIFKF